MASTIIAPQTPELTKKFVDEDVTLVFNYVLSAGQTALALQQPIGGEADFWLCGVQATSVLKQRPDLIELAGNINLRLSDDYGYKLQGSWMNIAFFTPVAGNSYPKVISPAHLFRAGTSINIDLQELSNIIDMVSGPIPNIVQILFRGRMRFRLNEVQTQSQIGTNGLNGLGRMTRRYR